MRLAELKALIRDVPDFPKKGIVFKDITPVVGSAAALKEAVRRLAAPFRGAGVEMVVGVEARGFIFAPAVALALKAGFVPVRKPGKLPAATRARTYALEYGADTLQIHADALKPGQKALVVDDLLATGGTVAAVCGLIEDLGAQVAGAAFLVELDFLKGRAKLAGRKVHSLIHCVGE